MSEAARCGVSARRAAAATFAIVAQSACKRERLHAEIDPIWTRAIQSPIPRSVAQPGSASDLGSEGRRFESYRSDQNSRSNSVACGASTDASQTISKF